MITYIIIASCIGVPVCALVYMIYEFSRDAKDYNDEHDLP